MNKASWLVILILLVTPSFLAFKAETSISERRIRGQAQIAGLAIEFSNVAENECEPTNDGTLECNGKLEEITARVDSILSADNIRCWRHEKWEARIKKYLEDGTPEIIILTPITLACDFP